MDHDTLNTARADIATDLPADESECCETGCDACEPDLDACGNCGAVSANPFCCAPSTAEPDPEALYDRLAVLTAEMSDEQRRELAELLLSGAVDAELLALVLRDQATVESDAPATVQDSLTVAEQQVLEQFRDDLADEPPDLGMTDPAMMAQDLVRYDAFHAQAAQSEPLAPEAIETVESAPNRLAANSSVAALGEQQYRDDTRLLQCCGVARLIGHRAGCAEVS